MNFKGISFYLGLSCYPITFLSFFNILYSSYSDHYLNLDSYILTLFISFLIGIALYLFSKDGEKNIKFYEKLVLIFLVYLLVSLLISIPYYLLFHFIVNFYSLLF